MIPKYLKDWFDSKSWKLRSFQKEALKCFMESRSALIKAPTGGGKTLAGFLASLIDIHENQPEGLHTLYISPLKALTSDVHRNLLKPIEEMKLNVKVETRTGDTKSHKRMRQRKKPPHILLTTPESLMLMLSYKEAPLLFKNLKLVIVDEIHSLVQSKRGDFCALALANLSRFSERLVKFGLSATLGDPEAFGQWLCGTGKDFRLIEFNEKKRPLVKILKTRERIPFGGHMGLYARHEIYEQLLKHKMSIVFVNTRAQAELMFQALWEINQKKLKIAVYHGSLSPEIRRKTEAILEKGEVDAVIATAAIEMGIDWGDIDLVIQVGAPKGVSRLLQRIGRSNHNLSQPSKAFLVPSNRFEVLECQAAISSIKAKKLDAAKIERGSLDVAIQYIVNRSISESAQPQEIYEEIKSCFPYKDINEEIFEKLLGFAKDGGYVLKSYEKFKRIHLNQSNLLLPVNSGVSRRHRQNIGTIVEFAKLKVKRMNRGRGGRYIGEIEENFVLNLNPGDTFLFAGEKLEFIRIRDMILEAKAADKKPLKVPAFIGGSLPLSTYLAQEVRRILSDEKEWQTLPAQIRNWLKLQKKYSEIPGADELLIESFPRGGMEHLCIYSFEGRRANQALGMLLSKKIEKEGLKPLSFVINDYALSISSVKPVLSPEFLLAETILKDELGDWLEKSSMLKRSFRKVATIAGLTEQQNAGQRKTLKQVTFSSDLIYDVLFRFEPSHILLEICRFDAEKELIDFSRLKSLFYRYKNKVNFKRLVRISPLAVPLQLEFAREKVDGGAIEAMLEEKAVDQKAESLIKEMKAPDKNT